MNPERRDAGDGLVAPHHHQHAGHVRFSVRNAFWVFLLCFLALASELGQYVAGYWQACSH
jgi:hypothetical protein